MSLQDVAATTARRYGLDPRIFVRQIQQESGFQTNVGSPAGAWGVAQFMPDTARAVAAQLGVSLDEFWASPELQLEGAARHMSDLLNMFGGNIALALAAYNAGPGNVQKYGGVPPFEETQRYVRNILGGGGGVRPPSNKPGRNPGDEDPGLPGRNWDDFDPETGTFLDRDTGHRVKPDGTVVPEEGDIDYEELPDGRIIPYIWAIEETKDARGNPSYSLVKKPLPGYDRARPGGEDDTKQRERMGIGHGYDIELEKLRQGGNVGIENIRAGARKEEMALGHGYDVALRERIAALDAEAAVLERQHAQALKDQDVELAKYLQWRQEELAQDRKNVELRGQNINAALERGGQLVNVRGQDLQARQSEIDTANERLRQEAANLSYMGDFDLSRQKFLQQQDVDERTGALAATNTFGFATPDQYGLVRSPMPRYDVTAPDFGRVQRELQQRPRISLPSVQYPEDITGGLGAPVAMPSMAGGMGAGAPAVVRPPSTAMTPEDQAYEAHMRGIQRRRGGY